MATTEIDLDPEREKIIDGVATSDTWILVNIDVIDKGEQGLVPTMHVESNIDDKEIIAAILQLIVRQANNG